MPSCIKCGNGGNYGNIKKGTGPLRYPYRYRLGHFGNRI